MLALRFFQIRVVKAFQSVNDSSHPNSLTTSTADRLRASYRRLKIARELEQQKSSWLSAPFSIVESR
ncbi:hypothetical protein Y032_0747g2019 [Ancylostoma ceylanicum]|uniref:Plasma membrane calcium transporting P-type ATPase C-terminal domain-containing protein n=1 Tax=Ancylostoma ceylanicum TaxID=53326 RepID=A0A016WEM0_9BILA|nr:hypothetical protein Y032_0747g2019 [Ancylostoma ceylanicum]